MSAKRTRVLVVDDSLSVRKAVMEALTSDPDLEIIGEAADGRRGIALCSELRPDVVTMDMVMPEMTGLAATEHIMAHCPTPILIVSASVNRREAFDTFDALAAGAVDVLDKPTAREPSDAWATKLRAAVKMAARIQVIRHPRARLAPAAQARRASIGARGRHAEPDRRARRPKRLAAIGGSSGAPAAAATILRGLPRGFPLPVLLVIHISPTFAAPLAAWLAQQTGLPVRLAADGELLPHAGVVLMAPADRHLLVRGERVRLDGGSERHSCRPSVDVLFESVARDLGEHAIGCLLTGMGTDGAAGLLAIKRAGGETMVQDERTSEIYGMPREAVRLGAASRVLPLDAIASSIAAAAGITAIPRGGGR
jgi:two-component system chemotaxis response regulator CheB